MPTFARDLRFALRGLRRNPGFAAVVVLTLSLAIGATSTLFSVVDQVLLRPLPFPEPDRLVSLWGYDRATGEGRWWCSYPDFVDFEEQTHSFREMGAYWLMQANLTGPEGEPKRIDTALVSHRLLPMLGVAPLLGRNLSAEDDRAGAPAVALLGERLWRRRFGADPEILGRRLRIDDQAVAVVGVVRSTGLVERDLVMPLGRSEYVSNRGMHSLRVVARLAPGVDLAQAGADVEAVALRLSERYPGENAPRAARLEPLHESVVGSVRGRLLVLFGAVVFVLLIACANVANLLVIRAASRLRDLATRSALGASGVQIARQLLSESLTLALAGGVLGIGLAWAGLRLLIRIAADDVPRLASVTLDPQVLAFTLGLALLTGALFGLAPVVHTLRRDAFATLRSGVRLDAAERGRGRRVLVAAEVALAAVLVIGAGLLVRSFEHLIAVDPGYRPDHLLQVDLELPVPFVSGEHAPRTVRFFDQLEARLAALPGVVSVSSAHQAPTDPGWTSSFTVVGLPAPPEGHEPEANFRPVRPGYFRTLGIPLLAGRVIEAGDQPDAPRVVVVNQAFVHAFLQGLEPLGQRLAKQNWWFGGPGEMEIVGVVGDVRFAGSDAPAEPAMYLPHGQWTTPAMTVLARTEGDPLTLSDALRQAVWEIDPNLPVPAPTTVEESLAEGVRGPRFLASLLGGFALVAALLAALGIYGVLAFAVSRRIREVGIRMALGARAGQVLALVLGQGLALAALGLVAGWAGAAALTRLLQAQLFEVSPTDPATFAGAGLLLLAVAALASLVPARRAARLDPVVALRHE